ncbi:MAG: hydantoinase B/oxoprolinase family protein [Gammaproteobacteria bacterium]|nr:hydantoinase B/oxoprolinase family protein [Gammaproteobacteria bacterium]
MSDVGQWQFWIDRGGTFTDVVALQPDLTLATAKLLSNNPGFYADAAAEGIRRAIAAWEARTGDTGALAAVKMGTTVATNALLERRGARTALAVTRGFGDALAIGYQNRPDIFALHIEKPAPVHERVIEIPERLNADGDVAEALDLAATERLLHDCRDDGITSLAICLMHGYQFPRHEKQVADVARALGFEQVSVSHEVEPLVKFVGRAETTLADAYLTPVLNAYIANLRQALQAVREPERLLFMQSNGGLVVADKFRGKDSVLSGPAAGVVGMAESAAVAGFDRLVGFDMGGTSTDVSAFTGEYERSNESEISGVRLRSPMMKIHTIAAGGGSVLRFADGRYQVGPASAGADPGPACYRRDGPLTVTDANVVLGRIPVDFFPAVFGPRGDQTLDTTAATRKFVSLQQQIRHEAGGAASIHDIAAGFLTIAVESMANAIRRITVERGEDVRDFTLCCFGGAAGQHACLVADVLGMNSIWLHPMAGVLSAYGMGLADIRVEQQKTIELPFSMKNLDTVRAACGTLRDACDASLAEQQVPHENRVFDSRVGLRVAGSDTVISVTLGEYAEMGQAFGAQYRHRFGTEPIGKLVVATASVEATGRENTWQEATLASGAAPAPAAETRLWTGGDWREAPVYRRRDLPAGFTCGGPAIVVEDNSTTVIDPCWQGQVESHGHLVLTRVATQHRQSSDEPVDAAPDPVRLEVFNRLFMHIAEQMGTVLQQTALSVNIRERLDFSCALFDTEGRLVSNAPHMPVHLGSMGESVRSVMRHVGEELQPGDAVMLNSPYNGGTHLPDITVVTPWFENEARPLFYLASRAHHADIGGITPGSMPAQSRIIDDEGVLIDNFFLVRAGELQIDETLKLLGGARHPARNPAQNIADLKAQLAANQHGIRQLQKAIDRYGMHTVQRYLRFVRENAAASVRRLLDGLSDGAFSYELDSGDQISVAIKVDRSRATATIDFTGTSPQSSTNFNAPEAVTRAAVLYVFRAMIREEIPMNEGCLEPLQIKIPHGSMLSPAAPAAVVAGNVETSQCVTDAMFGALGALAASQGTMNNLSFGNDRVQYYETICGGAGAGPGFDGADAVHTHMTNSRMTDVEVLEQKFPVTVQTFSVRRGSGGTGRWRGGDGALRHLIFHEPVDASILSNHRRIAPFGMAGGCPAAVGINKLIRADGSEALLEGTASLQLGVGDSIVIETPGGGGFGRPAEED